MAKKYVKKSDDAFACRRLRIGHKMLRETLMVVFHQDEQAITAFNSRLRRTIGLLDPDDRVANQRSPNRRYSLAEVLEIALCLYLQRAYVSPVATAEFIAEQRSMLHEAWARTFLKMDTFVIRMPLDAFREGSKSGRNLTLLPIEPLTVGRSTKGRADLPALHIDISDFAERTIEQLSKAPSTIDIELALQGFLKARYKNA